VSWKQDSPGPGSGLLRLRLAMMGWTAPDGIIVPDW
jgi:hypothetical protein